MSNNEAGQYLNLLASDQTLGYDVETNGLKWNKCHICGYGISDGIVSFYVPVRHAGGANIDAPEAFEAEVARIIKERKKPLIAHNAKFDMHMSANHDVQIKLIEDTMVRGALLNENRFSYSLENLCKDHKDITQKGGKELYEHLAHNFGGPATSRSMANFHMLAGDDAIGVRYAKDDNIAVKQLHEKQSKELYAQNLDVITNMEAELTYVLQKMERRGIRIDLEELERLKADIEVIHMEAYSRLPLNEENLMPLNVKSGKDLEVYFRFLGIEDWPITEKGNPSFNKLYLGSKSEGEDILHARKLDHFVNSFLTPLDTHIYGGRIHTSFNQARGEFGGAKPGRLSSFDPNLQQVPKRDKFLGKKFRKIFVADPGYLLIEFDYSQAEPRLFSHYSGEPVLIEGYNKTPFIDMHSVAAELMSIERDTAKNLNLGMQYGMGAAKLAMQLGITYEEARAIVKEWYKTFPRVGTFSKHAAQVYEQRGYVRTILGRRARCTDARFSYQAANRIVQGGSADILKWKMVEINKWIEKNNLDDKVQMLLNIHDSLVFQIREDSLEYIADLKRIMENVQIPPFQLRVPFVVEYKPANENWSGATYGVDKAA